LKEQIVTHPGFVKTIESNRVEIAIMSVAGCASCQLKGACSVSDIEEKHVWVKMDNTSQYKIGQQVTIEMKQSLGTWAVLLGYVFPFLVLLLVLILFISLGFDQGLSGLIALGMLVPYYTVLYLMRHWLDSRFHYSLRN
jgi:sigma-E factor negative regulatory protein RseC